MVVAVVITEKENDASWGCCKNGLGSVVLTCFHCKCEFPVLPLVSCKRCTCVKFLVSLGVHLRRHGVHFKIITVQMVSRRGNFHQAYMSYSYNIQFLS